MGKLFKTGQHPNNIRLTKEIIHKGRLAITLLLLNFDLKP